MIPKIFPRNLTARAAMLVAGNPVTTRLESSVGNCFPGLEFDHRNLDRRFFPGLIFEFTANGARLLGVDLNDPDLDTEPRLKKTLSGKTGKDLAEGAWFVQQITQGGTSIIMKQDGDDLDAMTSWRLVRCLQSGKVTIQLERRPVTAGETVSAKPVTLSANRRNYVDERTGVISTAYGPGELTQSLCSPWMHDFRDCACFYWASNHPDIVLAEDPPGEPTLPSAAAKGPFLALTPIDWLRADRSSTKPAGTTERQNRPGQMDHYEINQRWQDLAIVLQGREISSVYQPRQPENANPLASPDALAARLSDLAKLEHAVALEYLYALYSLRDPAAVADRDLKEALTFAQHEIFLVAVSEMRHLRWANQLIWSLEHAGLLTTKVGPSLGIADQIPVVPDPSRPPQLPPIKGVKTRPPQLRPLRPDVLQDFVAVEQPSGFLDGQYSQVMASLREQQYPPTLEQLAARIIADGMEHFSRFRQVQVVLRSRKPADYLRSETFPLAPPGDVDGDAALHTYKQILTELEEAYASGDMEDASHIAAARTLMFQLDGQARKLAVRSLGVPYFPVAALKKNKKKR
jgi:ferritin-like protein